MLRTLGLNARRSRKVSHPLLWGPVGLLALAAALGTAALAEEGGDSQSSAGGWTEESALILLGVLAVLGITMYIALRISAPPADPSEAEPQEEGEAHLGQKDQEHADNGLGDVGHPTHDEHSS